MKKLFTTNVGGTTGLMVSFIGILVSVGLGSSSKERVYVERVIDGVIYSDNVHIYADDANYWMAIPVIIFASLITYIFYINDKKEIEL